MNKNSFTDNPFFLLQVSPRDSEKRLLDRAAEMKLLFGTDTQPALNTLLHPSERLEAEIGYLPGTGQSVQNAVRESLLYGSVPDPDAEPELPLALLNYVNARLGDWSFHTPENAAAAVLALARIADSVSPDQEEAAINADRLAGGWVLSDIGEEGKSKIRAHLREIGILIGERCEESLPLWDIQNLRTRLSVCYSAKEGVCYRSPFLNNMVMFYLSNRIRQTIEEKKETISVIIREFEEDEENHGFFKVQKTYAATSEYQNRRKALRQEKTEELLCAIREWDVLTAPELMIMRTKGIFREDADSLFRITHRFFCDLVNKYSDWDDAGNLIRQIWESFPDISEANRDLVQKQVEAFANRR